MPILQMWKGSLQTHLIRRSNWWGQDLTKFNAFLSTHPPYLPFSPLSFVNTRPIYAICTCHSSCPFVDPTHIPFPIGNCSNVFIVYHLVWISLPKSGHRYFIHVNYIVLYTSSCFLFFHILIFIYPYCDSTFSQNFVMKKLNI